MRHYYARPFVALVGALASHAAAQSPLEESVLGPRLTKYHVTLLAPAVDLNTLVDMNEAGSVLGYGDRGYAVWSDEGQDFLEPGFSGSAIGDPGDVVVGAYGRSPAVRKDGVITTLATPDDLFPYAGVATDINRSGTIVGSFSLSPHVVDVVPMRWTADGRPIQLWRGPDVRINDLAISDCGGILVKGQTGTMRPPGLHRGGWIQYFEGWNLIAENISCRGVVGTVSITPNLSHPIVWRQGQYTFLAEPGGGLPNGGAHDINDLGEAVGWRVEDIGGGVYDIRGTRWDAGHGVRSLNELLDDGSAAWIILDAFEINDRGQIAGFGKAPELGIHTRTAIRLDPVE